jgi:FKBP-type peptidyl-prolyl cis-trans isomerase 2
LEFEVGSGKVIKGFDEAVLGMNEGEEKEFSIEPTEAYGERNEALKREVPKESVQVGRELEKGMTLVMQTPQGNVPVNILEVGDKTVTLDLNHPLAGKKLMFKIKVLEVNG